MICKCKEPKTHRNCAYCGTQHPWNGDEHVCGVCREDGIDGKLIRGTGRMVCKEHKEQR